MKTSLANAISKSDERALDRPIWSALAGPHKHLALGGALARRYPASIAPFAAMSEATAESLAELTSLIPAHGRVALFTVDKIAPPPNLEIQVAVECYQMILADAPKRAREGFEPLRMTAVDAPDMLRLTELTKPGPFSIRTHELGNYLGIRDGGELVAMAGERMRFNSYVEISAVCVHPQHRSKGYAKNLMSVLMQELVERGAVPILHVFTENPSAIALYEQLGFVIRRRLQVTVLQHAELSRKME